MLPDNIKELIEIQNPEAYFKYEDQKGVHYEMNVEVWGNVWEDVLIQIPLKLQGKDLLQYKIIQ